MKLAKPLLLLATTFLLAGCNTEDLPSNIPADLNDFDFSNYSGNAVDGALAYVQSSSGYTIRFETTAQLDVESENVERAQFEVSGKGNYIWCYATQSGEKYGYGLWTSDDNQEFKPYYYDGSAWLNASSASLSKDDIVDGLNDGYDQLKANEDYFTASDIKTYGDVLGKESIASRSCVVFTLQDNKNGESYNVRVSFDKMLGIVMKYELTIINNSSLVTSMFTLEVTQFALSAEIPNFPA